jgi:hypothetical protein
LAFSCGFSTIEKSGWSNNPYITEAYRSDSP